MSEHGSVLAYFRPRRLDDLKPSGAAMIGRHGVFEALWVIENGYDYAGEWAMAIPRDWTVSDFFWVPEGDLNIVERYVFMPAPSY